MLSFFYYNSVDRILSVLVTMLKRLEALEQRKLDQASKAEAKAASKLADAKAHRAEVEKSSRIRDKLKDLVS